MGNAKHLVVIGAGVLGSEIASAGRALGADVTLIGNKGQISFGSIGKALSSQIQDLHRGHGVALQLNVNITDVNEEDGFIHLGLGNGQTASGDIVVATIGTIARVEWLEGSGLEIADAVVCDEKGQASPGVYAVGDVAAWRDPTTGKATRVEHQTNAIDQAMSVAATIVDGQESIAPVPFFWSDIHGVSIKAYGWFYGHSLEKIDSTSEKGTLFASKEDGLTSGVISWDLAASAFRKSCAFVDESFTQRYRKLIVEEQR
jgi:NADPH-dependent 2,4-dienoyl-CoA reductase/sulfur reductase-like enzyme